jgi:hypothetical protein
MSSPPPPEGAPSRTPAAEPDDADDLRGFHFRELAHKPLTWTLVGGGALATGLVFLFAFGPPFGAAVFVAFLLFGIWATWNIADSRAADDFFHVYAKSRGLTLEGKTRLPAATPLLRKGDDRFAKRTLSGEIAPRIAGRLAIYDYVTESRDSRGGRRRSYHPFTLGMVEVPACADHIPELYCRRTVGRRAAEKLEGIFRGSKERVTLESRALDAQYEIFCAKGQDATWLRRLFTQSFIVWLTESAPDEFSFELVGGTLVAYVGGHKEDAADLDQIAAATGVVAGRLQEKSDGSAEPPDPGGSAG